MDNLPKRICKLCQQLRTIQDNKCIECGTKYNKGVVAKRRSEFEQQEILPGLLQPVTGRFTVNRPNSVITPLYDRIQHKDVSQNDYVDRGYEEREIDSPYSNAELEDYVEALYNFDEKRPGDLPIRTGDIITRVKVHADGYTEGRLGDRDGLFPTSYVQLCEKQIKDIELRINQKTNADKKEANVLNIPIGSNVSLINKAGDWYWVEYREKEGWIPIYSADIISSKNTQERIAVDIPTHPVRRNPNNSSPKRNQVEYVEAQCEHANDADGFLKFKKGDIITVINRPSDGFLNGKIGPLEGIFPANFVKSFDNNPEQLLQVIEDAGLNYELILNVHIGDTIKLKNKHDVYYWAELRGKEGWIPCSSVEFVPRITAVRPPLPPKPAHDDEIRIVLLGKTGSGKSATGNSILGATRFKSNISSQSVTKKCERGKGMYETKKIVLIDTPGLFDTTLSHDTISEEIVHCARLSLPGPHVFLIVLQITRLTKEENNTLNKLLEIFGTSTGKYSMIVFTRSDELKRERKSVESFIEEAGSPMTNFIKICNNHYIAIDNTGTKKDKSKMVSKLIQKITNIIKDNNGWHFTNAVINKTREAVMTMNKTENLEQLDEPVLADDGEYLEYVDVNRMEYCCAPPESHDSGVAMPEQSIYEEIHAEFSSNEINLNNRIEKKQREIEQQETVKRDQLTISENEKTEIELQLEKKWKETEDIKKILAL